MTPVSSDTRDSPQIIRHPSATDSLQSNLSKDVELTLNKTLRHSVWRESVSGIARSILLKAKDSIDTLRGASDNDTNKTKPDPFSPPLRSPSPAGGSLDRDDSADSRHASLSLRRVLTGSSRRSKRSPLLLNMMSKRSMSKPKGPEEIIDDAASAKTDISPAHASLKSLCQSKHSSFHSLTPTKQTSHHSTPQASPLRPSSPIPIPNTTPPIIDLQIESGTISPKLLFGFEQSPHVEHREPVIIPVVDTASRDHLIISSRRTKRQAVKSETVYPPVPRRTSNDHWRLRRAARNRSARLPDTARQTVSIEVIKTPESMPGTNLPIEDLFDSPLETELQPSEAATPQTDGGYDLSPSLLYTEGHLQSPRAGHIDPTSGIWISNDPIARALTPPMSDDDLPETAVHRGLSALQQAAKDVATRQVLLETSPDSLSPSTLRAELQAGRRALERLEQRMAGIEAGLLRASSSTPTPANRPPGPDADPGSRVTSSDFSFSSMRTPLEVQDLFYPSDNECWNPTIARHPSTSDDESDATSPEANSHLHNLQNLAANGAASPVVSLTELADILTSTLEQTKSDIPSMGDTFSRARSDRAARYYHLFHAPGHERSVSASTASSSSSAAAAAAPEKEEAFAARTPEMLSWIAPLDEDGDVGLPVPLGGAMSSPLAPGGDEASSPLLKPGHDQVTRNRAEIAIAASTQCSNDGAGGHVESSASGSRMTYIAKVADAKDDKKSDVPDTAQLQTDALHALASWARAASPSTVRFPFHGLWRDPGSPPERAEGLKESAEELKESTKGEKEGDVLDWAGLEDSEELEHSVDGFA